MSENMPVITIPVDNEQLKETLSLFEKILPQIGESGQLARIQQSNADSRIVAGGQQSRLVIDVALNQAPGSDINAQLRSNMPPPIIIPF